MDVNEYLNSFMQNECACGKSHKHTLPQIVVESGAIRLLPELIKAYRGTKVFVLADLNTYQCAGKEVCAILKEANIACCCDIIPSESPEPDEKAVGDAVLHFDAQCDLILSVGSGVINDIGKILAAVSNKTYFILATAPSMDGYASATSSMSVNGLKVSLPSKCPNVIVGDIDILKNAPVRMLQAGLGDMLAKYISIAEWRIAHEITGEYYCDRVAGLMRAALKRCADNADGLLKREDEAVKAVFEGLVIGGIAMTFAGVSRPASGVEHYFSHIWDMRKLAFGTKTELHGIQCAAAALIAARLYEKVLDLTPDKNKALNYAQSFNYGEWSSKLKEFLGPGADVMIALEEKEGKYSVEKHAKRLDIILEKWDMIRKIIREEIPCAQTVESILDRINAPKSAKEIGIDCDLFMTLRATKDIRDKYVLSRLLWDIGVIDDFHNENAI